jgi:mTERF domain-containing protein
VRLLKPNRRVRRSRDPYYDLDEDDEEEAEFDEDDDNEGYESDVKLTSLPIC